MVDICVVRTKLEFSPITFSVRSRNQTLSLLAVHICVLLMVFVLFISMISYTVKYMCILRYGISELINFGHESSEHLLCLAELETPRCSACMNKYT